MTVISVNIKLLRRVISHVTYSQYMKECDMAVVSVTLNLLCRKVSLLI